MKLKKNIPVLLVFVALFLAFPLKLTAVAETQAEKYKKKGNDYYKEKQYGHAIREYTNALMENMDYAEAFYNRGLVFYDLGQYYKAIVDFDMAIMLNPNDKLAYYSRGLSYSKVGKMDLALADIKKADKLGDSDAKKLLKSGMLTKRLDRLQQKNKKIESLIGNYGADFNRKTKITSRNNDFGGHTILTIHSKGDPVFDGKDGVFKTIEFFDSNNKLKKKEYLHTARFNEDNGRNKTVVWYDQYLNIEKKEFYYTGKMLNLKGVHFYDADGKIIKKAMFDKHGKEVVRK